MVGWINTSDRPGGNHPTWVVLMVFLVLRNIYPFGLPRSRSARAPKPWLVAMAAKGLVAGSSGRVHIGQFSRIGSSLARGDMVADRSEKERLLTTA